MNIHPLFVHFPVAFLTIYSIMEFIRLRKITSKNYWFYTKAIILAVGFLGALIALTTGDIDKSNFERNSPERQIISVHSTWAVISTYIYGLLVLLYIISWIDREKILSKGKLWLSLISIKNALLDSWFCILIAAAGLIAITITGALGGAIVYGPLADPFVSFIYNIFFK